MVFFIGVTLVIGIVDQRKMTSMYFCLVHLLVCIHTFCCLSQCVFVCVYVYVHVLRKRNNMKVGG